MNNTKTLETSRLILRKFNENDYIKMFDNWANDEKVTKYVSFWEATMDRRVIRTKKAIRNAFAQLLSVKELDDITNAYLDTVSLSDLLTGEKWRGNKNVDKS